MFAAQQFVAQHSNKINGAGYSYSSCPYRSPVKVEHIVNLDIIHPYTLQTRCRCYIVGLSLIYLVQTLPKLILFVGLSNT
jgi:hypothetical protein